MAKSRGERGRDISHASSRLKYLLYSRKVYTSTHICVCTEESELAFFASGRKVATKVSYLQPSRKVACKSRRKAGVVVSRKSVVCSLPCKVYCEVAPESAAARYTSAHSDAKVAVVVGTAKCSDYRRLLKDRSTNSAGTKFSSWFD